LYLSLEKDIIFQNTRLGDIYISHAAEAVEEDPNIVASKVTGADINADVQMQMVIMKLMHIVGYT
jgi:hypothetical protein